MCIESGDLGWVLEVQQFDSHLNSTYQCCSRLVMRNLVAFGAVVSLTEALLAHVLCVHGRLLLWWVSSAPFRVLLSVDVFWCLSLATVGRSATMALLIVALRLAERAALVQSTSTPCISQRCGGAK